MTIDRLTLAAEPLCKTQSWQSDGITVLTLDARLPQSVPGSAAARRFDRYYRAFLRAIRRYCEQELLPRAAADCRAAMARSAPWEQLRESVRFTVTFSRDGVLSLCCDLHERGAGLLPLTLRRADIWDTRAGLPLPAGLFFPAHSRWRARALREAREQLPAHWERAAVLPDSCWRSRLRRAFSARCCYLTDEGLCFFLPMYALAPELSTFTLPWDAQRGPYPPPLRS